MIDHLAATVDRQFPRTRGWLEELIRIPSVSAPGSNPAEVRRSAEAVARLLESVGLRNVRMLEHDGAHPAVFGEIPAPPGAPTVLLYAHHDVQPAGDGWVTAPFEPVEADGRLYGRGSSDDKCGVAVHAGAITAHGAAPPVGIKVFVEGEEEVGSPHLPGFLAEHGPLLDADVIVIADSSNWRTGQPAFTTSLRGLVDCVVTVRTKQHAVHSGMYGGVFPDALTCLAKLLATLHHDDGRVAVAGLVSGDVDPLDLTEAELRDQAGAVAGLHTLGHGNLTSRLWAQPAISVLAVDAPPVADSINALVPVAHAKVSMRLAPGQDPIQAMDLLAAHLTDRVPWGADVSVARGAVGAALALETGGPAYRAFDAGYRAAWGVEPLEIGVGGSIPFVGAFCDAYPTAEIVLSGAADQQSRAHGPNESVHLGELRNSVLAEAVALAELGR